MRNARAVMALALLALSVASSCGKPEPRLEDFGLPGDERNFARLINQFHQGRVEPTPWVGYWWPYTQDGIASSAFDPRGDDVWSRIFGHSEGPAAKYDDAHGGSTRAEDWERRNHGGKTSGVQGWWGHCNGWAAAAVLFPEPRAAVTAGRTWFGVQDAKALLTEAAMEADAELFGTRVESEADLHTPKYDDIFPDQYFLVLALYVGERKQAVVIDRYTGDQVWNQPLAGYRIEPPKPSDYLGAAPSSPDVYRIEVTSTLWWVRDDVAPDSLTPPFDFEDGDAFESRTLKMEVWLDAPAQFDSSGKLAASGDIVLARNGEFVTGGAWKMGEGHVNDAWPDYMWIPRAVARSTGYSNPELDLAWIRSALQL